MNRRAFLATAVAALVIPKRLLARSKPTEPPNMTALRMLWRERSSRTMFVDSQRGSDRNSGTFEQPFATVGKALQDAKSGDMIVFGGG